MAWPALWVVPLLMSALALFGVTRAIDPSENGPGVTIDEPFNVAQGMRLVVLGGEVVRGGATVRETFGEAEDLGPHPPAGVHLPDHPPLARLWLGAAHQLAGRVAPSVDESPVFVVAWARWGSAFAFALTVLLVGRVGSGWYGWRGGAVACAAVVLMPRSWGHAHLASIETVLNLVWTAAVLGIACTWGGRSHEERESTPPPVSNGTAVGTGILFGLLLLTKIQAILLPLPLALWALWHWRWRALRPLAIWGGVGLAVFVAGWPWLWLDPLGHLARYFGSATQRATLYVTYFGERFADRDVPWHYPFVMFLATVPVGFLLLGGIGLLRRRTGPDRERTWLDRREQFVLAAATFPLLVFAMPGVAVYDGVRLFLVVHPLWALVIARGATTLLDVLAERLGRVGSTLLVATFVTLQGWTIITLCPCHLSYYNLLVGGTAGADRLGMQVTYWGDAITGDLLEEVSAEVPRDSTVHLVPELHPLYPGEVLRQSPVLREAGIRLVRFDVERFESGEEPATHLIAFRREADWHPALAPLLARSRLLAEVRRGGVRLAGLYELPR